MRNLFPVLQSIIQHHLDDTHFNIHVDPKDGLISAAAEGYLGLAELVGGERAA